MSCFPVEIVEQAPTLHMPDMPGTALQGQVQPILRTRFKDKQARVPDDEPCKHAHTELIWENVRSMKRVVDAYC